MSRQNILLPVSEMAARYRAGESTRALGRACGVDNMTIGRRLRAAGVEMRPCGGPPGNKNGVKRGGPLHVDGQGYLGTYDRDGRQCFIHRACWEAYHGAVPEGHVVHHVDADRQHNVIENLACMSNGEHAALHNGRRTKNESR
jgi:hypothetical protein